MPAQSRVIPECRYGHGKLVRVDHKGKMPEWSLPASEPITPGGLVFNVALFICSTCGYAELFDLEPGQTVADEKQK